MTSFLGGPLEPLEIREHDLKHTLPYGIAPAGFREPRKGPPKIHGKMRPVA